MAKNAVCLCSLMETWSVTFKSRCQYCTPEIQGGNFASLVHNARLLQRAFINDIMVAQEGTLHLQVQSIWKMEVLFWNRRVFPVQMAGDTM